MKAGLPTGADTETEKRLTLQVLSEIFAGPATDLAGFRLWDGTRWPGDQPRLATIVLRHPGAMRAMLLPGHELGLTEAYLYDDFMSGSAHGFSHGRLNVYQALLVKPDRAGQSRVPLTRRDWYA